MARKDGQARIKAFIGRYKVSESPEKAASPSGYAQSENSSLRSSDFERLYNENYSLVYNYISYRMAGSASAEDVVSEAFYKAAKAFKSFDPARAKFSTWVISIARNCMLDHWRKERPSTSIGDVSEDMFTVEDEYPGLNEDAALVRKLLLGLEDIDRELVFMKYYRSMKNVDIARELDMNESTVATRLQRALRKMRAVLEKEQKRDG